MGAAGRVQNLRFAHYRDTTIDEYTNQWMSARCIFRTQHGSLGPGLETVRPRDRIYILQHAPVPYIFRHRANDPVNVLDLEGEAYAHGIMYSQGVETGILNFQRTTVY